MKVVTDISIVKLSSKAYQVKEIASTYNINIDVAILVIE